MTGIRAFARRLETIFNHPRLPPHMLPTRFLKFISLSFAFTFLVGKAHLRAEDAATIANPRVEYRVNPLGIDTAKPRLSWELRSSTRGECQLAYQVIVSSSEALLVQDNGDLWDTGKVGSPSRINFLMREKF